MVNTGFMMDNDPFLPLTHVKDQLLLGGTMKTMYKSVKENLNLHHIKAAKKKPPRPTPQKPSIVFWLGLHPHP